MVLFSVPPPHLVSSSNKSLHRSNASPVSHNCLYSSVIVFLAWSALKYFSGIGKWVGWEVRIPLPCLGKSYAGRRSASWCIYAVWNGLGLLCCSCLFSSENQLGAVLASCVFWCKQGSAPGSSGSELCCLNRLLGCTPSGTECHWNTASRISRACCPVLARGVEGRQRWKRTLL